MKVAVLTFIDTINYGALLQSYALKTIIENLGHKCDIIQYTNRFIEKNEKNANLFSINWLLRELIIGRHFQTKTNKFRTFEKKYITYTNKVTSETIHTIDKDYDIIIVGSDQVWNLNITNNDWHFYLDFINNKNKKISYAPSFGESELTDSMLNRIGLLLNEFKSISVREDSASVLLKNKLDIVAEVVLDPTLLLRKEDWSKIVDFKPVLEHYILVYLPHDKKIVFDFAKRLSQEKGLPIVYLSISPRIIKDVTTIYDASPTEFLGWIKHADYVVTGSFHGTAFSLIFEKHFFYEPVHRNSRIGNLVNISGTNKQDLLVADWNSKIDYANVTKKILFLQEKSVNWLKQSLDS